MEGNASVKQIVAKLRRVEILMICIVFAYAMLDVVIPFIVPLALGNKPMPKWLILTYQLIYILFYHPLEITVYAKFIKMTINMHKKHELFLNVR